MSPPKESAPLCGARARKGSSSSRRSSLHTTAEYIKQSLSLVDEFERDGHELRRAGNGQQKCLCPFHQERTPSCFINPELGLFHCFGCGASGSVIDYHARKLGLSVRDAIRQLAHRITVGGRFPSTVRQNRQFEAKSDSLEAIRCHGFESGTTEDLRRLASLRCLSIEGLRMAQADRVLWFATLHGFRAWVITDDTRAAAQARRLDGEPWEHLQDSPKAWTLPGSCGSWPVGAINVRDRSSIPLIEGGPDLLAAYHLMWCEERHDLTPAALLGASNSIHPVALPLFAGRRVRIFPHNDEAGAIAARRWHDQLVRVGATVDYYDMTGLQRFDDGLVDDLNDFMLIDYDGWEETRCEGVLP
jgi:hypothetical protein